ncbi:MAG: hypothetical protein U5K72_14405 [Balneolaceae bacterium]|nr:hypothetical protein [Balneolaceae bacterium]
MELTINKKRMLKAIDELPEDATIEEGIERLVFLHKIQKGLREKGGKTQAQIEEHFRQRRESRKK